MEKDDLIKKLKENSKYCETKKIIKDKLEKIKANPALYYGKYSSYLNKTCYFCNKPIREKGGWIIKNNMIEYYTHDDCE